MRKGALAISSGALKYLGLYLLSHYNPLRSQSWFIFEEHLTMAMFRCQLRNAGVECRREVYDDPVRGPLGYFHNVWHGKTTIVWCCLTMIERKFDEMFTGFDTMLACE